MSQEPWELLRDHDFTESDWEKVVNSLNIVTLAPADREELTVIKIVYLQNGFFDRSAKQFKWAVRPGEKAKYLDAVAKAARKLRTEMGKDKLDLIILPRPRSSFRDGSFHTDAPAFSWNAGTWERLIAEVTWLERTAYEKARHWAKVKAPPANVDTARAEAWASLAEFYISHTGKWPTGSPRISKKCDKGEVSGEYGEFLEIFMATIPGEPAVKGGEVRSFLRSGYFGERMKKFLNAHHGLLKGPPRT